MKVKQLKDDNTVQGYEGNMPSRKTFSSTCAAVATLKPGFSEG